MDANSFLVLEGLASCGCVFPAEKRAAVDLSLIFKKHESGLTNLNLWGTIFVTNGKNYILAQGYNTIHKIDKKVRVEYLYYFSQDGKTWLDLHPIPDALYEKCKEIKENFTGDIGATFFVPDAIQPPPLPKVPKKKIPWYIPPGPHPRPIYKLPELRKSDPRQFLELKHESKDEPSTSKGQEEVKDSADALSKQLVKETVWDEMDDAPKAAKKPDPPLDLGPKGVEIRELERLSAIVRWIDEECSVIPIGASVLTTSKQLVKNVVFNGVTQLDKLEWYGKLLQGYEEAPLSNDVNGVWTLHVQPLTQEVTIRSCIWPGYHFYYSHITKAWGSLYFGMGFKEAIDQVAFLI